MNYGGGIIMLWRCCSSAQITSAEELELNTRKNIYIQSVVCGCKTWKFKRCKDFSQALYPSKETNETSNSVLIDIERPVNFFMKHLSLIWSTYLKHIRKTSRFYISVCHHTFLYATSDSLIGFNSIYFQHQGAHKQFVFISGSLMSN